MLSPAELASMTTTVAATLDVSLPLARKTTTSDGYGHSTETWISQGNVQVNVIKPSATHLQLFAAIIGTQRALTLRALQTTDIREGDHVTYDNATWTIQALLDASSYTVTKEYLMTVVS